MNRRFRSTCRQNVLELYFIEFSPKNVQCYAADLKEIIVIPGGLERILNIFKRNLNLFFTNINLQ